jgi:hypothetical protein
LNYSIIGSGEVGTALARLFVRKSIEVWIANSRGPHTLASLTEDLGPDVVPKTVEEAYEADMIFLAFPFSAHKDVAKRFKQWSGKIVVDVTNAFHAAPEELGDLLSSEVIAKAFTGSRLVKAFNHLPIVQLGTGASREKQVVFVSSDDANASATVAGVATQLGFAPVELGRLNQGGTPLHVVDGRPGGLLFQNLFKLG